MSPASSFTFVMDVFMVVRARDNFGAFAAESLPACCIDWNAVRQECRQSRNRAQSGQD